MARPHARDENAGLNRTALLVAAGACIVAAGLEGWAAGPNVRARFAALRMPPYSPPFPVWIGIGVLYHLMFGVLFRIDRFAALSTLPYLCYLPCALWWGQRLYQLNEANT